MDGSGHLGNDPVDRANASDAVGTDLAGPGPDMTASWPAELGSRGQVVEWLSLVAHDMHVEQYGLTCGHHDGQPIGDHDDGLARSAYRPDGLFWLPVVVIDGEGDRGPGIGECAEGESAGGRVLQSAERLDLAAQQGALVGL